MYEDGPPVVVGKTKGPPNPKLVQQPDVVMGGMECECV